MNNLNTLQDWNEARTALQEIISIVRDASLGFGTIPVQNHEAERLANTFKDRCDSIESYVPILENYIDSAELAR